jgi:hypothetical protein
MAASVVVPGRIGVLKQTAIAIVDSSRLARHSPSAHRAASSMCDFYLLRPVVPDDRSMVDEELHSNQHIIEIERVVFRNV